MIKLTRFTKGKIVILSVFAVALIFINYSVSQATSTTETVAMREKIGSISCGAYEKTAGASSAINNYDTFSSVSVSGTYYYYNSTTNSSGIINDMSGGMSNCSISFYAPPNYISSQVVSVHKIKYIDLTWDRTIAAIY